VFESRLQKNGNRRLKRLTDDCEEDEVLQRLANATPNSHTSGTVVTQILKDEVSKPSAKRVKTKQKYKEDQESDFFEEEEEEEESLPKRKPILVRIERERSRATKNRRKGRSESEEFDPEEEMFDDLDESD